MDALNRILSDAEDILKEKERVVIAIDGKSGTGKSHLARLIDSCARVSIVHMDDFFLPKEKRTEERLKESGGNIDYERFLSEVLEPLKTRLPYSYRPFDCSTMSLSNEIVEVDKPVILIEGVYSLRPEFRKYYDLCYVLTAPLESRIDRIKSRSPEKLERYINEWMPLEDIYFNAFDFSSYPSIENY